jgi:hypothetical protein
MTRFSAPPSRLVRVLTTPGPTPDVDASCSTMRQQPDPTSTGIDGTRRKKETDE